MNYLIDAISNGYKTNSENRLTQVFCATFNNSLAFRKIFGSFIGINFNSSVYAKTQTHYLSVNDYNSILDIAIYKNGSEHPILIIENKIEDDLTVVQLKKYNKLRNSFKIRKIAIVKYFFIDIDQRLNWHIYRWSEFYTHIIKKIKLINLTEKNNFIIKNFINYLEEIGMSIIMEIPKSDLKLLAEAFHHVRSKNDPDYSVKKDPFKVASNYILMLKDIVFNMHAEEIIDKRLAKRLVFSPWISHWYNDVEEKKNLWLGFHISLKKAYNGISKIGTGIHFNNNDSNFKITGYVQDKSGEYLHETTYPDGDLIFEKYKYRLISFWKKWLK